MFDTSDLPSVITARYLFLGSVTYPVIDSGYYCTGVLHFHVLAYVYGLSNQLGCGGLKYVRSAIGAILSLGNCMFGEETGGEVDSMHLTLFEI